MSPKAIQSLIELFGVEKGLHILNIFTAMDDAGMHQQYRQFRMKQENTTPSEPAKKNGSAEKPRTASYQHTPNRPENRANTPGQTIRKPGAPSGGAQQAVPLVADSPIPRT